MNSFIHIEVIYVKKHEKQELPAPEYPHGVVHWDRYFAAYKKRIHIFEIAKKRCEELMLKHRWERWVKYLEIMRIKNKK